jgi:hypothetical protein
MQGALRPRATIGVAVAAASLVAVAPLTAHVFQWPATHTTTAAVALTAGPTDIFDELASSGLLSDLQAAGLPQLIGGDFDFTTVDGVQQYVDTASNFLLTTSQTIVGWADPIDQLLSPAGITGVGDWLTAESDLFSPILASDWDPVAWLAGIFPDNPEAFFAPIADFDLGSLYSALGAPDEAIAPLNDLLGLESSVISGTLNELLFAWYGPIGLTEQVLAGNLDLADPATIAALQTSESFADFVAPVTDSLNASIQAALDSLQALDMGGLLGAIF